MYDQDFFDRITIDSICGYLRSGSESLPRSGTLSERARQRDRAYQAALLRFRGAVRATEWPSDPVACDLMTDDLCHELNAVLADGVAVDFAAGFLAGCRFVLLLDRS